MPISGGTRWEDDAKDPDLRWMVIGLAPVLWHGTGGVTTDARLPKSAA